MPADEIASLQRTLDEGGRFSSKVISEAYEHFQNVLGDKSDKLLHRWAQINVMDCEQSLGQRSGTFRKQREQFQILVCIPPLAFVLFHLVNSSLG